MSSLTIRIYLTANILIAIFFLLAGIPLGEAMFIIVPIIALSIIFSLPAGFALYYCFKLVDLAAKTIFLKWILFTILLLLISFIPYLFASGFLSGELGNKELVVLLYFSEGAAFAATLLNCIPIHRFFKNTSNEIS